MASDRDTLAGLLARARRGVTAKVNDNDRIQADAVIANGWRPPAQVIETPENGGDYSTAIGALNGLLSGAVVLVRRDVFQSIGSGWWEAIGRRRSFSSEQVVDLADGDSVTVLWSPTEKEGR